MFLRRHTRKKNDETYAYWTLVESLRTVDGPRQRIVATIGKLPGLDEEARVERLRRFGEVYLGLALWKRLKLEAFFDEVMEPGREEIAWATMACILVRARFRAPSSELQIAEFWYGKTALDDLLEVAPEKVNDDRLYRALDVLLPHKDALFGHFQKVYGELFGATFDVLLYDITSTYFEGQAAGNPQAQRGYSRDSRPDCVQVCIALVVTPEGLRLAYEVFDGNRADVTTVEEIVVTIARFVMVHSPVEPRLHVCPGIRPPRASLFGAEPHLTREAGRVLRREADSVASDWWPRRESDGC